VLLDNPKVHTLEADLTDVAQAFNSLSCHFKITEVRSGRGKCVLGWRSGG
jgi:hypothetical protein